MAWRERGYTNTSVSYSAAKVETILLVLLMPAIAVVSVTGIGALRFFTPSQVAAAHLPSKLFFAIAICSLCAVVGNLWLDPRLRKYRLDPSPCLPFDTERDRNVAGWQKALTIVTCGLVLPLLAVVVTFWRYI